jgi:hypothetical protein
VAAINGITNALKYYSQVQDADKRRIDSAETLYAELHGFFRNIGTHENGEPTQKKPNTTSTPC